MTIAAICGKMDDPIDQIELHDEKYFSDKLHAGAPRAYMHGCLAGIAAMGLAFSLCRSSKQLRMNTGIMTLLAGLTASNVIVNYSYLMHRDSIMFERRLEAVVRAEMRKQELYGTGRNSQSKFKKNVEANEKPS